MIIIVIDGKIMVTAINIMLIGWLNIVRNLAINVKGWGFELNYPRTKMKYNILSYKFCPALITFQNM